MNGRPIERRCCQPGCEAMRPHHPGGADWYKSSHGFMQWACPEHAPSWRAFDIRYRAWEHRSMAAHNRLLSRIEAIVDWLFEYLDPPPRAPPSQPSIVD